MHKRNEINLKLGFECFKFKYYEYYEYNNII